MDPTLCDVQGLYQHQMKFHLEQCSVTHWQQIIKQINELKSMQLSIILKNQYINNGSNSSLFDNGEVTNITPTPASPNQKSVKFVQTPFTLFLFISQ